MFDDYSHRLPTFRGPEARPAPEVKMVSAGYPLSMILGAVLGFLVVFGAVGIAWLSARSTAVDLPEILTATPAETAPKPVVEPAAAPTSSVVGVAKRAAPKPVLPAITLQQAALADVERLREPAGNMYVSKPLKDIHFQTTMLAEDDPVLAEAQQLLGYYFAAKNLPEKSQLVLRGSQNLGKMTHFYSEAGNRDPVLGKPSGGLMITAENAQIVQLDFAAANRERGVVSAYFHRAKGGSLLLDWESFAGSSEMNWQEYAEKRPQTPVWLRAVADAGDYYNYEFMDDKHHLCVRLTSPDGGQRLYGFVPRGSPLGYMLAKRLNHEEFALTGRRTASVKVIVRTTFPYNAKSGQCVNIREMITDRWLMFDWEAKPKP